MNTHSLSRFTNTVVSILSLSVSVSHGAKPSSQAGTWGLGAINAPSARAITRGAGITIGVLDTGIQKNHPDLQANIAGGLNLVTSAGDATKWNDDNGHGTHIAGIIASVDNTIGYIGVAPSAKLFVVKVLHKDYASNSALIDPAVIANGINACVANGVDVINMSFGITVDSPVLHNAIIAAANAGVVLVASVGDNNEANVLYPAKYAEVIAVSSIQQNGYNNFARSGWSNWGPEVDFTAPGTAIYSTWIGSTYKVSLGTGQAAAYVSGVAALMLSAGKTDLVGKDVIPNPLPPEQQGLGLIDAYLTVTAE